MYKRQTLLSSRESGLRPITVSLSFWDPARGELRAEQQTLALYEGQTRVNALLEALEMCIRDRRSVTLRPSVQISPSSRILRISRIMALRSALM